MRWNPAVAGILVVIALASAASAQENGRIALDFGYPPALALLWRVTDRIALRPDFSFSYTGQAQNPSAWSVSPGVSALVSIHPSGALTAYAGARLAGIWIKGGPGPEQWLASGLVGARYVIERHFGVSAETGVTYLRSRFRFGPVGNTLPVDAWNVAPAGRVSALLYF